MREYGCDVLVIGAGPAGSSAARTASEQGLKVLLMDGKEIIGKPVRCAEFIPKQLLGELDLKKDFIVQPVYNMKTFMPHGEVIETASPGFIINREKFDQSLAKKAEEAGAELWRGCKALYMDDDYVIARKSNEEMKIKVGIIIGADGPHSKVARWIGSANKNLIPALQVRVELAAPLSDTEVYFHEDLYGGYGWLFPRGKMANVGLGMKHKAGAKGIKEYFKKFIIKLQDEKKIKGGAADSTAGWIPAECPRTITENNIMLTGDAAGQTHPVTGAGIAPAVICGKMAGKWAARAVKEKNPALLFEYEKEYVDLYGKSRERAFGRRVLMENRWDDLEDIIKKCWVAFREYYRE